MPPNGIAPCVVKFLSLHGIPECGLQPAGNDSVGQQSLEWTCVRHGQFLSKVGGLALQAFCEHQIVAARYPDEGSLGLHGKITNLPPEVLAMVQEFAEHRKYGAVATLGTRNDHRHGSLSRQPG